MVTPACRAALLGWAALWAAGPVRAAETMRIAITGTVARVEVRAPAGAALSWGQDEDDSAYLPLGRERLALHRLGSGLALEGQQLPVGAIRVRAQAAEGQAEGPAGLSVNGVAVRGDVVVVPWQAGLVAINVVPLEDYLHGVLGSEMPASFPLEALKAQAVAARTYALSRKLQMLAEPWHVASTVLSQVYRGLAAEAPRTREAVDATAGQVLTFQLEPIEAYFHASCGGHTEAGLSALGRDLPYLRSVDCPCGSLSTSHWTLQLSARELKPLGGTSLRVAGRTRAGRVSQVQVGPRQLDGTSLRERLGYTRLKSLDFSVATSRRAVVLRGRGFGHGAGLCQWGARLLAERGLTFTDILSHYYPGTELQQLY